MKKILYLTFVCLFVLTGCSLFSTTPISATQTPTQQAAVQNTPTMQPTQAPTLAPTMAPTAATQVPSLQSELEKMVQNPFMMAYQKTLEYSVPSGLMVSPSLMRGFVPVKSLVNTAFTYPDGKTTIKIPATPKDVQDYSCFPQDYSKGDEFNPGCQALQLAGKLPWKQPLAGYNDGENWSCDSPNGWCADDIQSYNWRVITGYEVCHPAVGCLKDPNGGAVMLLIGNIHDSDEAWNARNSSAVYVDSGFIGYGMVWDWDHGVGETLATLRNHFLYRLAYGNSNDNALDGQCGSSTQCTTVTYVVVLRSWDRTEIGIKYSHFELLDYGQWTRPSTSLPTPTATPTK